VSRPPEFHDLFAGGELAPDEEARLRRAHDLLVAAGPPPELSPTLEVPPAEPRAKVIPFLPRRRFAAIGVAAGLALTVFVLGYTVGERRGASAPQAEFTVPMTGTLGAKGDLVVFTKDGAGNWPMRLQVSGLPDLDGERTYELWLTKRGKLVSWCGAFTVHDTWANVPLNAPYRLREYDGWVVVKPGTQDVVLRTATV
jgi:hypothetical protein